MTSATGVRIRWADLPGHVRAEVERLLGDRVVAATSQPGGFSPGTADRVRTAGGRRAFVKAVHPMLNQHSPGMHRREARISAALPAGVPAPGLLGSFDDGEWVALVLEDVEGRNPATPWRADELSAVLSTLDRMARAATPAPLPDLPRAVTAQTANFTGWHRIATEPPGDLDGWIADRLPRLCGMAERGLAALAGDTLCHTDIRADNLLIRPDGSVVLVDWPWASRAVAWFDPLLILVNVRLFGGHDTTALLRDLAQRTGADLDDLLAALVGLAGYFADAARQPPPPGLPTARRFQRAQADSTVAWLHELLPA